MLYPPTKSDNLHELVNMSSFAAAAAEKSATRLSRESTSSFHQSVRLKFQSISEDSTSILTPLESQVNSGYHEEFKLPITVLPGGIADDNYGRLARCSEQ